MPGQILQIDSQIWKCNITNIHNLFLSGFSAQDTEAISILCFSWSYIEAEHYKPENHPVYMIPSYHILLNFFYITSSIYTTKSRVRQGIRGNAFVAETAPNILFPVVLPSNISEKPTVFYVFHKSHHRIRSDKSHHR